MFLKRTAVFAAVVLLCVAGACSRGTQGGASSSLTIKPGVFMVGMEIGYPPMEYYDTDGKTPIGFDVELAKALADKLGLQVEFVDTAWDGIFAGVTKGDYDVIMSSVTITPERVEAFNFTKPYIGNAQAMVLLKGSTIQAKRPEELAGLGVAYQAETVSDIYMTRLASEGLRFTAYEYDKVMNCFDELELGRIDAIVCDSLVAVDYIAPADSPFEVVWQGPSEEVFAVCLRKGNDALTAELDKALDALFTEGTIEKISMDIFKMDMVSGVR